MREFTSPPASLDTGPRLFRPEVALGRAFRCGLLAVRTGEIANWAFAWQELATASNAGAADRLVNDLGRFVKSVEASAQRRIGVLPAGCPGLCRDECLAVSIIAACQHGACPALRACAFALLASADVDGPLSAANCLAETMKCEGQFLSPDAVCNAAAFVPDPAGQIN